MEGVYKKNFYLIKYYIYIYFQYRKNITINVKIKSKFFNAFPLERQGGGKMTLLFNDKKEKALNIKRHFNI
jgi:hypothetical protein